MNRKHCIYHANVNVNLMEQNVIQINGGITQNVNVNVKKVQFFVFISLTSLLIFNLYYQY